MAGFYSVWPFFLCVGLIVGLAATPWFKAADSPPSPHPNRIVTVDGLRGFLALAVVFHHCAVYHRLLADGVWEYPPSHVLAVLGQVGVALFFMITGYLFWSQLLRAKGRPSWVKLYTGRVFRIGPLYLAAIAAMFFAIAVLTHATLREPASTLLRHMSIWLGLGLFSGPELNGYNARLLLADVTWTLRWEWLFYLSLPVIGLGARMKGMHLPFVVSLLAGLEIYLYSTDPGQDPSDLHYLVLFLLGMLCASLDFEKITLRLPNALGSVLIVLLVSLAFRFETPVLMFVPQLMLGAAFYLILCGSDLLGLLTSRPALRLGDISYGIYLLQGLVLAAIFCGAWTSSRRLTTGCCRCWPQSFSSW